MTINIDLSDLDRAADRFAAMPALANAALQDEMQAAMRDVASYIQANKLSGQVLNARSGRLRDSITPAVDQTGAGVGGTIGSDVPYAAIHEYGGTILRDKIRPWRIVEPERSYLRTSLAEQAGVVQARLTEALIQAIDT